MRALCHNPRRRKTPKITTKRRKKNPISGQKSCPEFGMGINARGVRRRRPPGSLGAEHNYCVAYLDHPLRSRHRRQEHPNHTQKRPFSRSIPALLRQRVLKRAVSELGERDQVGSTRTLLPIRPAADMARTKQTARRSTGERRCENIKRWWGQRRFRHLF